MSSDLGRHRFSMYTTAEKCCQPVGQPFWAAFFTRFSANEVRNHYSRIAGCLPISEGIDFLCIQLPKNVVNRWGSPSGRRSSPDFRRMRSGITIVESQDVL